MRNKMPPVKLIPLDGRHSHRSLFDHMLQFSSVDGHHKFSKTLVYCSRQWGISIDVELYAKLRNDSQKRNYEFDFPADWSYLARYGDYRVYLTKDAATWIQLAEPWNQ